MLCSAEHKGRNPEERGEKSSFEAPLTSIVFFPTMEVNGAPKQPGYKRSTKYLSVRQNKDIHTGLELLEGK